MKLKTEHVAVAGVIVLAAALLFSTRGRGRFSPSAFSENDPSTGVSFPGVPAQPSRVHTAHRYPPRAGAEVTTAIHHGLAQMAVPGSPGMAWLIDPPSEVIL